MSGSRKKIVNRILENLEVMDAGAEGKAVARAEEKVVFIPYAAPGDVVDVRIVKKKKAYLEGKIVRFHKKSEERIEPLCEHYGLCGGCKWQHLDYQTQLKYKQKQVEESLKRIGKCDLPEMLPIVPAEKTTYYRNKLEYTFSCHRWLTEDEISEEGVELNTNALGFHIPGRFDKIVDINHCFLQDKPSNEIRLAIRDFAIEEDYSFFDARKQNGELRNLVVRDTTTGGLMVIVIFYSAEKERINKMMEFVSRTFPQITSLMYIINGKGNDSYSDLKAELYKGEKFIFEHLDDFKFAIGPVSFFQTNSHQALELYRIVKDYATIKKDEIVYDLFTGTGTIANYVAKEAKKVVGIEYVDEAIVFAKENSRLNKVANTDFYAGDVVKVMNDEFIKENGRPDVIITDPPRAGMHKDVVMKIMEIEPDRIVYVSCNPATQARDLEMLKEKYTIQKLQAVDMFPHTHHVESVLLLKFNKNK